MAYRKTKYLTLTGIQVRMELGDSSYWEWVIYEGRKAKYHIHALDHKDGSDGKIYALLNAGVSMDEILDKINKASHQRLNQGELPFFRIRMSSYINTDELKPLPLEWLNLIS